MSEYAGAHHMGLYPDFTLAELEEMPVLHQGQADDCHVDTGKERVWLCRCDTADGAPWDNMVTVENLVDGRWVEVGWYEAS